MIFLSMKKLIKSMANDISEFKNALTILCDNKIKNNELDYVNELKKLTERIDTLEINTSQASEVSVTNRFTKFHEIAHYENYEYLSSSEDISNRISLNLQAVGLTKNSAEKLARLTLATFVSGTNHSIQWLFGRYYRGCNCHLLLVHHVITYGEFQLVLFLTWMLLIL
ncbi:Uncharacterised protein [Escherichia coli]|uniref:Uncharacterized protein n=1 Tax=Escherichia coli TaxID=562 RepID=A0A376Y3V8_ECOLX|nr:Uncharacterised protein [Escherichia coli]